MSDGEREREGGRVANAVLDREGLRDDERERVGEKGGSSVFKLWNV